MHGKEDRSQGRNIWLVYGTRYETDIYYEDYFQKIAASRPNFFYQKTLSRASEGWTGARGYVQEYVSQIAAEHARLNGTNPRPVGRPVQHSCLYLRAERNGVG